MSFRLAMAAFAACSLAPVAPASSLAHAAEAPVLHYLDAADVAPRRMLPAPPPRGSQAEALELATLHRLIAAATSARLAQATWDGEHEDASLFNATLQRDLAKLPATWALLTAVQDEARKVTALAKTEFARLRPYGVDPTMPTCTKINPHKAATSYPSGHATVGYATGWVLARLMPERAPDILARAQDYALSRQLCGTHFPSDTEASHMLATLVADRLLAAPRLAPMIAAARAELAAR